MELAEKLFEEHADELYAYLCRFTSNSAEAEDVLGDVFVKAIEEERLSSAEGFEWRPWLYRVATNCAISRMRRAKVRALFRRRMRPKEEGVSEARDSIDEAQTWTRVRAAIKKLGARHKAVLLLQVYQDLSYQEIADALCINVGTVRSRLFEAKERVKATLLEGGYEWQS